MIVLQKERKRAEKKALSEKGKNHVGEAKEKKILIIKDLILLILYEENHTRRCCELYQYDEC